MKCHLARLAHVYVCLSIIYECYPTIENHSPSMYHDVHGFVGLYVLGLLCLPTHIDIHTGDPNTHNPPNPDHNHISFVIKSNWKN